jgi:non-ribosomal peptide synthetase component F
MPLPAGRQFPAVVVAHRGLVAGSEAPDGTDLRRLGRIDAFNLPEILRQGLDTRPDADVLVSPRRRWTWLMLDSVSARLAGSYLELGLAPGDRIASLMPNRSELIVHYLACMKCGLVAVPLNYRYMAPEIDHALEVSGAKIVLAHDERRDDLTASELASRLQLGQIHYGEDGGHDPSELRVADRGRVGPREGAGVRTAVVSPASGWSDELRAPGSRSHALPRSCLR